MDWKEMRDKLKKNWLFSSVLTILIGLILLLFPGPTLTGIGYAVGGIAIAMGVIRSVRYFRQDHTYPFLLQSDLVVGLLTIAFGIFMVSQPVTVMSQLPLLFGILLAGCGIGNILRAVDANKAGDPRWGILLGLAIVSVILGLLIMANPFGAVETVVAVIGACLIYQGATDILTTLLVSKKIDAWKKSAPL